jgi:hypothetical protein
MLLAKVNELALMTAKAEDQTAAQHTAQQAVDGLFERLLGAGPVAQKT